MKRMWVVFAKDPDFQFHQGLSSTRTVTISTSPLPVLSIPSRIIYARDALHTLLLFENFQFHQGLSVFPATSSDLIQYTFNSIKDYPQYLTGNERVINFFQFHQGLSLVRFTNIFCQEVGLSIPSRIIPPSTIAVSGTGGVIFQFHQGLSLF